MTLLQKIRTSFTTKLSLSVAGFVIVISGVVVVLLANFSEGVIRDETIDATMQALENTALRIDNTLRQAEMTARLEHGQLRVNRSRIERLIDENSALTTLQKTLPNAQLYVTRRDTSQFDAFITGGESGYRQLVYDDKDIYIFSQPVGERQYCLVAAAPAEDIYGKYARMQWILLTWSIIAVLALLYILYLVIGHHLRPLHRLADSAQAIADGALETPIADTRHQDETGRLQNSLSMMQRRLAAYMAEMQQKRDTLNHHHAELQAAYNEAQAYEKKKAKFLHDMTDRMAAPVELLCHSTDVICRDYQNLSKAEMTALQTDIMESSETIIKLLDQLIKDPAGS
jgi:methyl-accepting chemotaxis protein